MTEGRPKARKLETKAEDMDEITTLTNKTFGKVKNHLHPLVASVLNKAIELEKAPITSVAMKR